MITLLYAVTEAATEPTRDFGTGLEGRSLRAVGFEDLTAIVSDYESVPPGSVENLWAYEETVERLMSEGPLLPARFGTTAGTDAEIEGLLRTRHQELIDDLERVRDAVELSVRTPVPDGEESTAPSQQTGTEYMLRRLAERRRADEVDEAFAGLVRAQARPHAHATAYLVPRTRVDEFMTRAGSLGLTVTGPWPPYSFVTESRPRAEAA